MVIEQLNAPCTLTLRPSVRICGWHLRRTFFLRLRLHANHFLAGFLAAQRSANWGTYGGCLIRIGCGTFKTSSCQQLRVGSPSTCGFLPRSPTRLLRSDAPTSLDIEFAHLLLVMDALSLVAKALMRDIECGPIPPLNSCHVFMETWVLERLDLPRWPGIDSSH